MHIVYDTRRFATRGAGGFGQLEGLGSRRFHYLDLGAVFLFLFLFMVWSFACFVLLCFGLMAGC